MQAATDELRHQDHRDEAESDDEFTVQVAPQHEQRNEQPHRLAAASEIALDEEQRQRRKGEGEHLDARPPDGESSNHRDEHAETEHSATRIAEARLLHDREEPEPRDRGEDQHDEPEFADAELHGEQHLVQPFVHRPVMVRHRVRERVVAEQTAVLQDQLAGAKMPPEIGVLDGPGDRERHDDQHRGDEEPAW